MFEILSKDINAIPFEKKFSASDVGGVVTFEGRVRNHNEGRSVLSLEYEAYQSLALKEGHKIIAEAKAKFDVKSIYCVHRTGHLQIGDLAVWVQAASAHRKEAFLACQYVIDEIKSRVPIWKREHYVASEPVWVNCAQCSAHGH